MTTLDIKLTSKKLCVLSKISLTNMASFGMKRVNWQRLIKKRKSKTKPIRKRLLNKSRKSIYN